MIIAALDFWHAERAFACPRAETCSVKPLGVRQQTTGFFQKVGLEDRMFNKRKTFREIYNKPYKTLDFCSVFC